MAKGTNTDLSLIEAYKARGGEVTIGKTQGLQKNIVYNSGNSIRIPKRTEYKPVKDVWNEIRKAN